MLAVIFSEHSLAGVFAADVLFRFFGVRKVEWFAHGGQEFRTRNATLQPTNGSCLTKGIVALSVCGL